MRVATYTRVQKLDHRWPSNLARRQIRLHAYGAAQPGWVFAGSYRDVGPGRQMDRPGLTAMLTDADSCCFDLLLVDDPDRLSSNSGQLCWILSRLVGAGVRVHPLVPPRTRRRIPAAFTSVIGDYLWGD